jgi:P27 family predicted phage terminase small subunit
MGKRGFQPAPTALKLLKGTRPDRINDDEPQPREGLPTCPDGVSPEVRKIWDYTVAELSQMRCVSPADRDGLRAYCEAVHLHRLACEAINKLGLAERAGNGGAARHPAVAIQRDAAAAMRQWAQEFGLTPAARSQIRVGAAQPKKGEGAARLLSG